MEKNVEFYELTFSPGGKLDSDAHFEGTREILTVAKGQVDLSLGAEQGLLLTMGNTAHYPADRKHLITNPSCDEAMCYLVVSYA
jgi:quercetin dioxygenase-like cupin family protein